MSWIGVGSGKVARFCLPSGVGGFFTAFTRGVAARHTLATIWHPSRMRQGSALHPISKLRNIQNGIRSVCYKMLRENV